MGASISGDARDLTTRALTRPPRSTAAHIVGRLLILTRMCCSPLARSQALSLPPPAVSSTSTSARRGFSSWAINSVRILLSIRQAVLYDTLISRSSCFAEMPQRVLVITYMAKYHRCRDVEDFSKIVPAVGWTWCPQPVQVHD